MLSSLPKFRKGILAFIRCKELNTVDFQTDTPIQTQKKLEAQQSLTNQIVRPNSKKRPSPRVRFDSHKSEKSIFDSIDEIDTNDTTDNKPSQKSQAIRWSKPTSQKKVTFAVETVIMTQKQENVKLAKLIRFRAGHIQNFQIVLLHRHNCTDNFRRTSL